MEHHLRTGRRGVMSEKYPLLKAWQQGQLKEVWEKECAALKQQDPKLLDWVVGYEAAARASAHISQEEQRLAWAAKRSAHQHRHDPNYTDDVIEFHDALQDLRSYREQLQDISGNPQIMIDEWRYLESVHHMTLEQMEAHSYEIGKMEMESF
jgi:hypothetical protein